MSEGNQEDALVALRECFDNNYKTLNAKVDEGLHAIDCLLDEISDEDEAPKASAASGAPRRQWSRVTGAGVKDPIGSRRSPNVKEKIKEFKSLLTGLKETVGQTIRDMHQRLDNHEARFTSRGDDTGVPLANSDDSTRIQSPNGSMAGMATTAHTRLADNVTPPLEDADADTTGSVDSSNGILQLPETPVGEFPANQYPEYTGVVDDLGDCINEFLCLENLTALGGTLDPVDHIEHAESANGLKQAEAADSTEQVAFGGGILTSTEDGTPAQDQNANPADTPAHTQTTITGIPDISPLSRKAELLSLQGGQMLKKHCSTIASNDDGDLAPRSQGTIAEEPTTSSPTTDAMATTPAVASPLGNDRSDFVLHATQLGPSLVPHLAEFFKDEGFRGVVRVEGLPEVDWNKKLSEHKFKLHDCHTISYKRDDTVGMRLQPTRGEKLAKLPNNFRWPAFGNTATKPTEDEMRTFLEHTCTSGPEGPQKVVYYGGPPPPDMESYVDAGETLKSQTDLRFITTSYLHAGEKHSGTTDHFEDGNLRSMNLVLDGIKVWRLVAGEHAKKLDEFARREWPEEVKKYGCAQFLRHIGALISPSTLEREGIEYRLVCAGPGDLVLTAPGEYHLVVNMTACIAVSVNFLLPGEIFLSDPVWTCTTCGLATHEHPNVHLVEEATQRIVVDLPGRKPSDSEDFMDVDEDDSSTAKLGKRKSSEGDRADGEPKKLRRGRSDNEAARQIRNAKDQIEKADPRCRMPSLEYDVEDEDEAVSKTPSPKVFKLAAAIQSRIAISQLMDLVRAYRSAAPDPIPSGMENDRDELVKYQLRALKLAVDSTQLSLMRERIRQLYLAEEIEKQKQPWRLRADAALLNDTAEELGLSRRDLDKHLKHGRRWKMLNDRYPGILCLILLNGENPMGISPVAYSPDSMPLKEAEELMDILSDEYLKAILPLCEVFQRMVGSYEVMVPCYFEGQAIDVKEIDEGDMLRYLKAP